MNQLLLFPDHPPAEPEPPPLNDDEQEQFLEAILKGAGPQIACDRLNRPPAAFSRTWRESSRFQERLEEVRELMTHNVLAAVYASAIRGTGPAQSLWLKTFPPVPADDPPSMETANEPLEHISETALQNWLHCGGLGAVEGG